jgi:signal transduction histidine kinase
MTRKTLYAFIVSFILLIIVIILNGYTFNKMKFYSERVDHTREVITVYENISDNFKSAIIYTPTYLDIPEKQLYLTFKQDAQKLDSLLHELKRLAFDNKSQLIRADTLSSLIHSQADILLKMNVAELIKNGQAKRLAVFLSIDQIISQGIQEEKQLLAQRQDSLKHTIRLINLLTNIFAVVAIVIILLTGLENIFVSKRRKWLEGFLESILNTSKNGIIYYRAQREKGKLEDFRIDYANIAIKELLEIKPSDILGKPLKELPSFVKQIDLHERFKRVIETGNPEEFEFHFHTGLEDKWFVVSLAKLQDGVTATFHNISQLKYYQQGLKENIQQLESSNNELEQYAYVASHDLQEPLRKIRSFGSYLQESQSHNLDEKGKLHLEKIMNAAERMSILIRDILSFSSMKRRHEFTPVDLNIIIDGIMRDLELLVSQKNAVIKKEKLPVIDAIPLQMTQLFYNLLNNSLKFVKEKVQPVISISARKLTNEEKKTLKLEPDKTYFEIIVKDNGIGFSEEYQEQIFGLFKRLNERHIYPGSGIGLALCRKVVSNHNGIIYAKAKDGDGAEFHVILPEKQ